MFHTLYRAAWLESKTREEEAKAAEEKAKKEAKQAKNGKRQMSSREALEKMRGISGSDMEDIADEIGMT